MDIQIAVPTTEGGGGIVKSKEQIDERRESDKSSKRPELKEKKQQCMRIVKMFTAVEQ